MPQARALVVDDDPVSRIHAVNVLNKLGWRASGVSKPPAAADTVKMFGDVRLALVDWQLLPADPTGLEIIQALRALPTQPPLCILLYTGNTDPEVRARALAGGANGVIAKPIEAAAVKAQLASLGIVPG
jgi:CheY-like chemotaxis protein